MKAAVRYFTFMRYGIQVENAYLYLLYMLKLERLTKQRVEINVFDDAELAAQALMLRCNFSLSLV